MTAAPIGFFQFDNLVRAQIPFLLVHPGLDFSGCCHARDLSHIQKVSLVFDFEMQSELTAVTRILAEVSQRKLPDHYPIVVVCQTGTLSQAIAEELDSKGLINSFYILGGIKGLQAEP